eukprot:COSAG06_NODE_5351_length_3532_cov_2.775415_2_plen_98_part_00
MMIALQRTQRFPIPYPHVLSFSSLLCSAWRLVWSGLVWSGLVWSGLVWSGLVISGHLWSASASAAVAASASVSVAAGLCSDAVDGNAGGFSDRNAPG